MTQQRRLRPDRLATGSTSRLDAARPTTSTRSSPGRPGRASGPAWSSLERWLPVQINASPRPVPRIAWLLVGRRPRRRRSASPCSGHRLAHTPARCRHPSASPATGPSSTAAPTATSTRLDRRQRRRDQPDRGADERQRSARSRPTAPSSCSFVTRARPGNRAARRQRSVAANADGTTSRPLTGSLDNIQDVAWSHDATRVTVSAT